MGFLWNGTLPLRWIMGTHHLWIRHDVLPPQWALPPPSPANTCSVMEVVYSTIGAMIFSLYIIFDTYNICNSLHPDDYVAGAISLYGLPSFHPDGQLP